MSYYDQPAVKPSLYGWKVALYTFLGGMAGAAQVIATLADLLRVRRRRTLVRNGRYLAAATGAAVGPALLIIDLHTPQRFYNMLRIFRPTSPMSIGTYVLMTFAGTSVLALTRAGRAAQVPAAVAGAGMATYTASLLASTATPLWSSAPRHLGAEFATGAFAAGAAALALAELAGGGSTKTLDRIAGTATLAYAAAGTAASMERRKKGVNETLERGQWAPMHRAGLALGIGVPLACFALNALRGPSRTRSAVAHTGILAGVFLSRWALFGAGNASARNPRTYLQLTAGKDGDRHGSRQSAA